MARALVLSGFGINCEEELAAAYSGADIIHLSELFERPEVLQHYAILNFPGGFSFGDDLGAGRLLATSFKFHNLFDHLLRFLDAGGVILGICNGFQVLVALGLLPGLDPNFRQQVTLAPNRSGHFQNEWCRCHVPSKCSTPCLEAGSTFEFPIRHAEGRLACSDPSVIQKIVDQNLICLKYCDNPNGSLLDCAGMTNPAGNVIGIMPHPEAFLTTYNHPDWMVERADGLTFFNQVINGVTRHAKDSTCFVECR